jgi:hypothetical protein
MSGTNAVANVVVGDRVAAITQMLSDSACAPHWARASQSG